MLSESYQFIFGLFFAYGVAIFGLRELKSKHTAAPPQSLVARGFAGSFLEFGVKQFREPRKKRQFPKPANACGSSHCGLL